VGGEEEAAGRRQGVDAPPSVVADAVGGVVLVRVGVGGPAGSVVRPDVLSVPALPGIVVLGDGGGEGGSVGRPSDGTGDG
ncbi:hypothetical protein, partial [Streptomyces globisporus]|uniref:hypothetical protein n=1 Tax=Streptomyces globisporus TaxID=1908 RepID=UPI00198044B5